MNDVTAYFGEISNLLENKFFVSPSGGGNVYEVKETGQAVFSISHQNISLHRCISMEKGGTLFPAFKTTHPYAHRRSDRLFVLWDAKKQRFVFLACELKSRAAKGAWTQSQVTLAFARQLDGLARVNRPIEHETVFASITAKMTPFKLKKFNPAKPTFDWCKQNKSCALKVHHAQINRDDGPLRLKLAVESLP